MLILHKDAAASFTNSCLFGGRALQDASSHRAGLFVQRYGTQIKKSDCTNRTVFKTDTSIGT
jgi:hypothetical protein